MSMFVVTDSLAQDCHSNGFPRPSTMTVSANVPWYGTIKYFLEILAALVLLVMTLPLLLLAMLLVKLTSRGPAIYLQTRVGRGGLPFTIYKIRTMTHNCESLTGAQWSRPGDTRVTALGRWLRRSHIDELPQLWNVLRGDMSLIGPRPERPEFVPRLEQMIPQYGQRLNVRPGVTGLAQVQLPPDTDLESVCTKLAYDLHYVKHVNFVLDMRIYWATLCKMFGMPFCMIQKLFQFPPREVLEREYQDLCTAGQEPQNATLS
jgi:lipopolysaccharide/colanic/teichoic acid biosynthesis glycosyltransferase